MRDCKCFWPPATGHFLERQKTPAGVPVHTRTEHPLNTRTLEEKFEHIPSFVYKTHVDTQAQARRMCFEEQPSVIAVCRTGLDWTDLPGLWRRVRVLASCKRRQKEITMPGDITGPPCT
jgi:hypothetical protein